MAEQELIAALNELKAQEALNLTAMTSLQSTMVELISGNVELSGKITQLTASTNELKETFSGMGS